MNIFSLTQRWSPVAALDDDGEPGRPHFQVIMNEVTGERVAGHMSALRFSPQRLIRWAAAQLPEVEAELWLDRSELLIPFTRAFPEFTVKLQPSAPHLNGYFQHLEELFRDDQTADDYSLVDLFGDRNALRFYKAAWEYLDQDLYQIPESARLEYRDPRGQRYSLEFSSQDEPGFMLSDPQGNLCLGVSFDNPAFVAARDLELLDRQHFDFGTAFYPWLLFSHLPGGLTRDWFETLIWLFEAIPNFAQAGGICVSGPKGCCLDWCKTDLDQVAS
ncbi:hypothetical protein JST97_26255 [bacterium]|nr:hypothetical protein [bacterium]